MQQVLLGIIHRAETKAFLQNVLDFLVVNPASTECEWARGWENWLLYMCIVLGRFRIALK